MRGATNLHVRPTRELARQIRRAAKQSGLGIGALMCRMAEDWFQRNEPEAVVAVRAFRLRDEDVA